MKEKEIKKKRVPAPSPSAVRAAKVIELKKSRIKK